MLFLKPTYPWPAAAFRQVICGYLVVECFSMLLCEHDYEDNRLGIDKFSFVWAQEGVLSHEVDLWSFTSSVKLLRP